LIRIRQLATDGRLPPVLSIVLYNGATRWNAPEEFRVLIQPGPRALERFQPQARYLLIDEGLYSNVELEPLRNLVSALFRLENSRSEVEVLSVVRLLVDWLRLPEQASLRRAFVVWINRVILKRTPGGPVEGAEDLQTMGTLIEARMQEWEQGWLREGLEKGREQGLEEGLQQGLRKGEAQLLHRLLRHRFGALPDWVEARLSNASAEQLEQWAERLLDIDSLDALFER
jgi:hypothetical protein